MKHKDYLDWLNSEISEANEYSQSVTHEAQMQYWFGRSDALASSKEKFLTIDFSHSPAEENTENNFTDGLS